MEQIKLALVTHGDVVMVLHADGHLKFARPLGAFLERRNYQVPLRGVAGRGVFVCREMRTRLPPRSRVRRASSVM